MDEEFVELLAEPDQLPRTQALAVALLLRHSWRADDLARLAIIPAKERVWLMVIT